MKAGGRQTGGHRSAICIPVVSMGATRPLPDVSGKCRPLKDTLNGEKCSKRYTSKINGQKWKVVSEEIVRFRPIKFTI